MHYKFSPNDRWYPNDTSQLLSAEKPSNLQNPLKNNQNDRWYPVWTIHPCTTKTPTILKFCSNDRRYPDDVSSLSPLIISMAGIIR